ncbi:hypothetical protein SLEP1_g50159 [Rubroshorea leprosula]|uniref:Alpha/beta hydrolase fold-3 domain-containing protein n=1 Tax=Rubroshorea leprosula TaxID=152421 RepID=A0AAV5M2G4_9ROSI|nr:hypothetical protein SLEP1_g50159 [Rubroshorea leprosula]
MKRALFSKGGYQQKLPTTAFFITTTYDFSMAIADEVVAELETLVRVYKDGSVERCQAPIVPPPLQDPETRVSSKDITISANPRLPSPPEYTSPTYPILPAKSSPSSSTSMSRLVHHAKVVAVSIEYRLAPEHPLPIAFEDCWARLQWVAAHSGPNVISEEPWLSCADFERLYLGGDNAGASLAHYVVMSAGKESLPNNVKISRAFYTHPKLEGISAVGVAISVPVLNGLSIHASSSPETESHVELLVSASRQSGGSLIEYRLAPEHPFPIAFEDCWAGLQWVAAHSGPNGINEEPWLSYADFERLYIGGDSAGASLAHYVVMRAGKESLPNNVKISRAFYTHPYFWGSEAVGSEPTENRAKLLPYKVWIYLYPTVPGGIDSPMTNPVAPGAPSLAGLGCSKLLVSVSEKDILWSRGISFYNAVKESGWKGEAELIEVEGEGHAFHIVNYESESAKKFIVRLASFLK